MKNFLKLAISLLICSQLAGVAIAAPSPGDPINNKAAVDQPHKNSNKKQIPTQPVDINSADLITLTTLKGIGPKKAHAILEYRKQNGSFSSAEDLSKVKGIGAKAAARIIKNNPGRILTKN